MLDIGNASKATSKLTSSELSRKKLSTAIRKDGGYIMGYPTGSHANILSKLTSDEVFLKPIQKGVRAMRVVSESGLYKLIMRSDKAEAKAFQDWVTRDVLPAIRKDGGYIMDEEKGPALCQPPVCVSVITARR